MKSKITMIEAQKRKGRFNVYVDGKYAFPMSENVMIKYRVFKGMEIDAELKNKLVNADEVSKLYSRGIDFLSHQLRTESEVVDKLKKYTENEQHIAQVMQRLTELELVNDQNYANSYVRTEVRKQDKGPNNVFYKLKKKKIPEAYIENAIENFYSDEDMRENCTIQIGKTFKKHRRDAFKNRLEKTKIAVMKKGYPMDVVLSMMDSMEFTVDEEQQMELLRKQFEKVWYRNRRYDHLQRVMKTKQSLYRKGFEMDDINRFIEEKESEQ